MSTMAGAETSQERTLLDLGKSSLPKSVQALERGTKTLPTEQDFHFFSNFEEFKDPIVKVRSRVVALLNQLGSVEDIFSDPQPFPSQLEDGYGWLVGVQDDLLERVDASLDRFYAERKGQRQEQDLNAVESASKRLLSARSSLAVSPAEDKSGGGVKIAKSREKNALRSPIPFHIPSIPRPQDKFDERVDNSNTPFQHRARKSGDERESEASTSQAAWQMSGDSYGRMSILEMHARKLGVQGNLLNSHPLEEDLKAMDMIELLPDTFEVRKYNSLEETSLSLVTTVRELKEMAAKLRQAGEIAVDLENHHYRSYQGFVCLMQISTREEDFVIDTLDLRSHIGPYLGDIFSDPTIKKVMHGANSDIVWLQRDFGVYVCNLFDTGQAARVLHLQGFGLAHLLEQYCGVLPDKRYQLADWRIRPLPLEMIKYAREDTHYLLYIYDMLRKELSKAKGAGAAKGFDKNRLLEVYKRSRDICLQLYTKEIFTETSYTNVYGLQEKKFRPEQMAVLAGLYAWRDQTSRREDESTGYVMPNHLLVQLVTEMPGSMRQLQTILKLAKGSYSLVSQHGSTILDIIRQSRERALKESQMSMENKSVTSVEDTVVKVGSKRLETSYLTVVGEMSRPRISEGPKQEKGDARIPGTSHENDARQKDAHETGVSIPAGVHTVEEASTVDQPSRSVGVVANSLPDDASGPSSLKDGPNSLQGPAVVSTRKGSSFFGSKPKRTPPASASISLPLSSPLSAPKLGNIILGQHPPSLPPSMPASEAPVGSGSPTIRQSTLPDDSHDTSGDDYHPQDGETATSNGTQAEKTIETASSDVETSLGGSNPLSSDALSLKPSNLFRSDGPEPSVEAECRPIEEDSSMTLGATANPDESARANEAASVLEPRRTFSKFGAFLGGRKKQTGFSGSLVDLEKAEKARIRTQEIETSMTLPFSSRAVPRDEVVFKDSLQFPVPAISHVDVNDHGDNASRGEDEALTKARINVPAGIAMASIDRASSSFSGSGSHKEIIMLDEDADLDNDADEGGQHARSDRTEGMAAASSSQRQAEDSFSPKHRLWWPNQSRDQGVSLTKLSKAAHDQTPDQLVAPVKPLLPPSLSEMCAFSKRGKKRKKRNHTSASRGNPEGNRSNEGTGEERADANKRVARRHFPSDAGARDKQLMTHRGDADVRNFNYREARNVLGLHDFYSRDPSKKQQSSSKESGRRRKNERRTHNQGGIPASKTAFDPLRRAREDPKAEGFSPGPRRQVFPQSGNRTATFK